MKKPSNEQIENVLEGLSSPDEARMVAQWLATKEGLEYFSQHFDSEAMNISNNISDLIVNHKIPTEKILAKIEFKLKKRRILTCVWRVAAILIPVVFCIGVYIQLDSRFNLFGKTEYEEVYVPKGERIQMMFQDGTKIYLNSDSYLKYPFKFGWNKREVELRGEAYFIVAKNKKCPFIVNLGGTLIKVLGTSFHVNAYPNDEYMVINLDEGKINVVLGTKEEVPILPGQSLIYDKLTDMFTIGKIKHPEISSVWKENIIAFKDEPINDVFKKLERWYDVKFVCCEDVSDDILITLESKYISLDNILEELKKITPLLFDYDDRCKIVYVNVL